MPAPILETEGLAKRFGGVVATDKVTLAMPEGELRCIIGPNGAGKSTLFSLFYAGSTGRTRAESLLKGSDVTGQPAFRRVRQGLGLTFQTNRAYNALSVQQNLEIARRTDGAERSAAAEERFRYALDLFGLEAQTDTPARELPHHRLQWLEIAMVLAGGPSIVLLDEPTAGLSPEETLHTARVLQYLNRSGLTVVVVEHDIAFVREVAQHVTVLHQGRIFAEGTVDEITAHEDVRRIYLGRA